MNLNKFFQELKRRNVFKVATAYGVTAWLIIQVLVAIEKPLGIPEGIDTVVIWALIIGFPLALIIAWIYEWTNKGLQKTEDVDREESITSTTGKKLNRIIISSLSLVVILLLVERIFFASDLFDVKKPSIAVLPFGSQSTDDLDVSLAEGLSAEVISEMGRIEGLKIIAQTSSFRFTKVSNSNADIANELGVRHLLTGRVSRRGTAIVVEAKLLDTEEGSVLWSDKIERTVENLFDIQSTIIKAVTEKLRVDLLPSEEALLNKRPTDNPLAYELYIQTRQTMGLTGDEIRLEIELLKKAIELDSTFAKAHATLAIAYDRLSQRANLAHEEKIANMEYHVKKAFELDANEPMAFRARSWLIEARFSDGPERFAKAEEDLLKTISMAPNNALAFNDLQINLRTQNRDIEADSVLLLAWELDPLNAAITHNVAGLYSNAGNKKEAVELLEKAIKDHPDFAPMRAQLIDLIRLEPYGRTDESFKLAHKALKEFPNDIRLLETLVELSRFLDLTPMIEKYMNQYQLLYPENFGMMMELYDTKMFFKDYEFVLNFTDMMEQRFRGQSGALEKPFARSRASVALRRGDYDLAKSYILKGFPEVLDLDFDLLQILDEQIQNDVSYAFLSYSIILKEEDKKDSSLMYVNKLAKYYAHFDSISDLRTQSSKNILDELLTQAPKVSTPRLFSNVSYQSLTGDVDGMIETLEELYFERKAFSSAWQSLNGAAVYKIHDGNPKYEAFKRRIMEDVHKKRAVVINYLKEQGEWDNAWDAQLN
ncbi:hypothetical protein [Roseivirga sp. E12]|uniref:hypothetical protein n=1 Tax=Roseivirga sp. E12 TaxID=2819237 RepID=UPI001ABCB168|nr:hypothetical protein [Roseivirga sp. E12]MBO3700259.1 hypothetical protein [Roseivirga sp. E12]